MTKLAHISAKFLPLAALVLCFSARPASAQVSGQVSAQPKAATPAHPAAKAVHPAHPAGTLSAAKPPAKAHHQMAPKPGVASALRAKPSTPKAAQRTKSAAAAPVAQLHKPARPAKRAVAKPAKPAKAAKPVKAVKPAKPAKGPEPPKRAAAPAPSAPAVVAQAAAPEPLETKRDPFMPLLHPKSAGGGPEHLPPGKAGLVVSTVRIDGTVEEQNHMIAVVSNPEDKVYFIREGDRLYDGEVEKISLDGVTFKETSKDAFGKPVERTVTKRIYASAGEAQ
ncbi:MAG TPA: pilus assembly protein PilP [Candidatus Acidoferrales bacterium]|nr:pilus assembly protein PilP [Candidatus Acidoferrales bacterium]